MAIVYFPESVIKKYKPAIDVVMQGKHVYTSSIVKDTASVALDEYISATSSWQVNSLRFLFSGATTRTYDVTVQSGRKVLAGINDSLWFHTPDALWQKIILTPGFYTGSQLATLLQSLLNANQAYIDLGKTFTVTYNNVTGIFTITPSTGTLRYLQTNNTQVLGQRDSYGGHLMGLTANTAFGSSVVSNVPVMGLNSGASIIEATNSTVLEHYNDDPHVLSIDQALHVTSSVAGITVSFEVGYELLG